MQQKPAISKLVWLFSAGIGLLILVVGLNFWLIAQVKNTDKESSVAKAAPSVNNKIQLPGAIPVIDPKNDLLAPVETNVATPESYLKRQPQENSDQQEPDFPQPNAILVQ
ncbi:MAG: hypothetical protein HQL17_05625 [Candidatus Omnitrophica bacterium]|nr:hypothetical protein [Candidatus Omnitrophota bacterium]